MVCERWKGCPKVFEEWSLRNGWAEGLELDKDIIPTKLGVPAILYSPEMCTWVTHAENMLYLSSAPKYLFNGELMTMARLEQATGIPKSTLIIRLNSGRSVEEAVGLGSPKAKSGDTKFHTYQGETLSLRAWCKKLSLRYSLIRFRVNGKGLSLEQAIKDKVYYDRKDRKYTDITLQKEGEIVGTFFCIAEIKDNIGGDLSRWRDLLAKEIKQYKGYTLK